MDSAWYDLCMSSGGGPTWTSSFIKKIETFNLDAAVVVPPLVIIILLLVAVYDHVMFAAIGLTFLVTLPLWLPFLLLRHMWAAWIHYIRFKFWMSQKYVLLEITVPQEVMKSPLAMEVFLTALWNAGGEATFISRMWEGKFRAVWSLEIASNEGRVAFYLHLRANMKNIVESRLYGQFPEVHVVEVEDYVKKVPFSLTEYDIFGVEYALGKPPPFPIRTYMDFGLDRDPKEEFRIDPITHTIEVLGQIGKDEYYWTQIICVARKKDQWYGYYSDADSYNDEKKKALDGIMQTALKRGKSFAEDETTARMSPLTDGEKRAIEAIEKKSAKLLFECGIRTVYLARKERYNGVNNGSIIRFFDHIRSNEFNSLGAARGMSIFDYPWQDFRNIRANRVKRELYSHFRDRAYFYAPYDQEPLILNTEELATLWHFPGSTVQTPALSRKLSRTSEAPPNLPL
jgi:hypothetical protein